MRGCACRRTAELCARVVPGGAGEDFARGGRETNLDLKVKEARWTRWSACSCASKSITASYSARLGGRAGRRTWVGEEGRLRCPAMSVLGNGLFAVDRYEESLSVRKATLSMLQRVGASEGDILTVQSNLTCTYGALGDVEKALSMEHDVYSGHVKLYGEESVRTLIEAINYASWLLDPKASQRSQITSPQKASRDATRSRYLA